MPKTLKYDELLSGAVRNYDKVGKVSSTSVKKHTGKDWKVWVGLLEKAGARNMTHQEIVALLKRKYRLGPWWQQGVTLGFEIATGRRKVGQDTRGKYMVTATKSLAVDVKVIWRALLSTKGLSIWLRALAPIKIAPKNHFETKDGFFGEIRTTALNRKVRMTWQDPDWEKHTTVEVVLVARPKKRSILVFNHTGLPTEDSREQMKKRWRDAADRLALLATP